MSNMKLSTRYINHALNALREVALHEVEEFESFKSKTLVESSDDKNEFKNRLFQSFPNSIAPDDFRKMSSFTPLELASIFKSLKLTLSGLRSNGREKRGTYFSMDVPFATLSVTKTETHGSF